jgi:uncharacterized protein YihD (DUF1040 family)
MLQKSLEGEDDVNFVQFIKHIDWMSSSFDRKFHDFEDQKWLFSVNLRNVAHSQTKSFEMKTRWVALWSPTYQLQ